MVNGPIRTARLTVRSDTREPPHTTPLLKGVFKMTDTPSNPEPALAEAPTAPRPPIDVPAAAQAPAPDTWAMPGQPLVGSPAPHRASEGAIAAMVIGSLLFAMLAFGAGWTARGVAQRLQFAHGGAMTGQQFASRGLPGAAHLQDLGNGYGQRFRHGLGLRGRMGLRPNRQLPGGMPGQQQDPPRSAPSTPTP